VFCIGKLGCNGLVPVKLYSTGLRIMVPCTSLTLDSGSDLPDSNPGSKSIRTDLKRQDDDHSPGLQVAAYQSTLLNSQPPWRPEKSFSELAKSSIDSDPPPDTWKIGDVCIYKSDNGTIHRATVSAMSRLSGFLVVNIIERNLSELVRVEQLSRELQEAKIISQERAAFPDTAFNQDQLIFRDNAGRKDAYGEMDEIANSRSQSSYFHSARMTTATAVPSSYYSNMAEPSRRTQPANAPASLRESTSSGSKGSGALSAPAGGPVRSISTPHLRPKSAAAAGAGTLRYPAAPTRPTSNGSLLSHDEGAGWLPGTKMRGSTSNDGDTVQNVGSQTAKSSSRSHWSTVEPTAITADGTVDMTSEERCVLLGLYSRLGAEFSLDGAINSARLGPGFNIVVVVLMMQVQNCPNRIR
jgi:hypothetical protein